MATNQTLRGDLQAMVLAALVLLLPAISAGQTAASWTGGAGTSSYDDPDNWSTPDVPVNTGTVTYDVTIPDGVSVVFDVDGANEVTDLTLGAGATLTVAPGESLTVLDDARIYGLVTTDNGTFLAQAAGAQFPGNAARLAVTGGGHVAVAGASLASTGIGGSATLLSAQGAGSLLDVSGLASLDAYVSASYTQVHTISATSSGTVDLSGLETLRGRDSDDRLEFVVNTGGAMDLSSLAATTAGTVRFVIDAASFSLPSLASAVNTTYDMAAIGSTLDLPALTSQSGGTFNVPENGTFDAPELTGLNGVSVNIANGGTFNAPKLTSFTGSALSLSPGRTFTSLPLTTVDNSRLAVTGGTTLAVAATSYSSTGLGGSYTLFSADGAGSVLDLSTILSLDADVGASYTQVHTISATASGTVDLSGVETVRGRAGDDRLDFVVSSGGTIDLSNLAATTAGNVRFAIDATSFSLPKLESAVSTTYDMQAAGATLDLPVLLSHSGGAFNVPAAGACNVPELTTLAGVTVSIGDGGSFNAAKLASFTNSSLALGPAQTFAAPPLVEIHNSRLAVTGGATLAVAATGYSSTDLGGSYTVFSADGAGSALDLSAIQSIDAYVGASYTQVHSISATAGATVDLSGLETVRGRAGDDRLDFVVGSGGTLDLSNVVSTTEGNVRFAIDAAGFALPKLESAVSTTYDMLAVGSVLDLPVLTSQTGGAFNVPDSGTFNAPELTTLSSVSVSIADGGTFNAPKLTAFTNSTLSLDTGRTFTSLPLTTIDNSRLAVAGGATLAVAATSYSSTGLGGSYTLFSADGAGSVLDLSSILSIDAYVGASYTPVHTISATASGTVNLSGLETVRGRAGDDRLDFVVGSGGTIDLSNLVSTTAGNVRFAIDAAGFALPKLESAVSTTYDMLAVGSVLDVPVLTSQSGGAFNVPDSGTFNVPELTVLSSVSVSIADGGTFNAPKLTAFTNSALSLDTGRTFTSLPLTAIDNSRLAVTNGATLAVAATSYSSTGLGGSYTLFSADGAGSVLDLSTIQSLDAYVSASYTQVHTISATGSGTVDLSGLETVRGRAGDDRLDFVAHSDGFLDLSSLHSVTAGNVRFVVYGGGQMTLGDLTVGEGVVLSADGTTSGMEVLANLHLGGTGSFAATGGAQVTLGGNLSFNYTNEASFNGDAGVLQFDGTGVQWLEVGGADGGVDGYTSGNFGLGQLIVGSETQVSRVFLTDLLDNGNRASPEALYLYGSGGLDGLVIHDDSTLLLGNINAYALIDGEMVWLNDLFAAGETFIDFGGGFLGNPKAGDATLDDKVNYLDVGIVATNYGKTEMLWTDGDFTLDQAVNYLDVGILATNYGWQAGGGSRALSSGGSRGTSVPEPAGIALLAAGAAALAGRRRRR